MKQLIGLSGKKRTGKNTIAAMINHYAATQTVRELSFATELKKDVARMLGVELDDIETNKSLYRGMLQAVGCYRRDSFGADYWIKKVEQALSLFNENIIIITDVRFLNEAEWIKSKGGKLIRVSRVTGLKDEHESEVALDDYKEWDSVILNTGTLEHLAADVKELMKLLEIESI